MGVKNLWELLEPSARHVSLEDLAGMRVAVGTVRFAYLLACWLADSSRARRYQYLAAAHHEGCPRDWRRPSHVSAGNVHSSVQVVVLWHTASVCVRWAGTCAQALDARTCDSGHVCALGALLTRQRW